MVARPGQVLQQVAEHAGRRRPQLDPRPVVCQGRCPGVAAGLDVGHPFAGQERLDSGDPVGHRRHQVDVLGRVRVAAKAAGDLAALDGRARPQLLGDPLRERAQARPRDPRPRRRGAVGEALQDQLLGALAKSGELAHLAAAGGGQDVVQRREAEVVEDPPSGLGADAVDPHHRHDPGRVAGDELVQRLDMPAGEELGHLRGDRVADRRQARQPSLLGEPGSRVGRLTNRAGRPPVGEHPVDDGPLQLQQVAHQLQALRDLGVGLGGRHRLMIGGAFSGRRYAPPNGRPVRDRAAHVQRAREPAADGESPRRGAPPGAVRGRRPGRGRWLAGRHGGRRRRARRAPRLAARAASQRQAGTRPGVHRRLPVGARRRLQPHPGDGLRPLPSA